jgi:hypothetical protein
MTERHVGLDYAAVAAAMVDAGVDIGESVPATLVIRAGATQWSRPIKLELSTPYVVKTDFMEMVGIDLRISDSSQPERFPIVTGEIVATPEEDGTRLSAGGWYRAPYGLLGAAADGLLMRGAGRTPVVDLLEEILNAIERLVRVPSAGEPG